MRILAILLLLAGCAADNGGQPGSFTTHVDGVYTTMGGMVNRH